ncbi:MAG: protein-export chaperone SecB [Chthoniobacterales bacterium]
MKKSPLELVHYFVTDVGISANKDFDPEKEVKLDLADLNCVNKVRSVEGKDLTWRISLRVQQETSTEKNSPYNFWIRVNGLFKLNPTFPKEKAERFVTTNGTAILYAVAREALRSVMANGPYLPLLLPSVSFLTDEKPEAPRTRTRSASRK